MPTPARTAGAPARVDGDASSFSEGVGCFRPSQDFSRSSNLQRLTLFPRVEIKVARKTESRARHEAACKISCARERVASRA